MQKILFIQTSYLGDVILATSVIEELEEVFPEAKIDYLVRKGNEQILENNPHLNEILIWNKKESKYRNLLHLLKYIRNKRYDLVINAHRFFASGVLTAFSKANKTIGYKKNPLSFLFSKKVPHFINIFPEVHETERLFYLISDYTLKQYRLPKLYPNETDKNFTEVYKSVPYICIAPNSVWFTKQLPIEKWIDFLNQVNPELQVYCLGGKDDFEKNEKLIQSSSNKNIQNLSGKLSILQSASLMEHATMNFVNDSAPLHIASSVNAKVAGIFCSTTTGFGFGPLSDESHIIEIQEKLPCRPCGIHGKKECPKNHFKCGYDIDVQQMLTLIK